MNESIATEIDRERAAAMLLSLAEREDLSSEEEVEGFDELRCSRAMTR